MAIDLHACDSEADFWRTRNFLREIFLRNGRLEHSWHVARLDQWRWHFIDNCRACASVADGLTLARDGDGRLIAAINDLGGGELRLHVDPDRRTPALEDALLAHGEARWATAGADGRARVVLPILRHDTLRQSVAAARGYRRRAGWGHHYHSDLPTAPLPAAPLPPGYALRAMGDADDYAARSWASWCAFHSDEPDSAYDGDASWYANIQISPLYRRDLDVVAVTDGGEIAAFATAMYDDYTRSAVPVLVGTAAAHWRRGLGRAVVTEALRRVQQRGGTRVFATAVSPAADRLYGALMPALHVTDTWVKLCDAR